jgi:signal peptidase II
LPQRWRAEKIVFGIAAAVLALDQLTKWLVLRYLPYYQPWNPIDFLRPIVTLIHITNTGAAFGIFQGANTLFSIISMIVIAAIVLYYRRVPADQTLVLVSIGLQLGGATGNLVDRLFRGHVIDFIDFHFWPVFNVADSAIVIGVVILAYYLLFVLDDDQEALEKQELESRNS